MAFFDMPLEKLRRYRPTVKAPSDFDAFWKKTLTEAQATKLAPHYQRVDQDVYSLVDVYDLTFQGFAGQEVKGWFIEPAGNKAKLPCLVTYIGYGGGRSLAVEHVTPATCGISHLVMDTRGQGCSWSPGATPDMAGSGPQFPGFMTRGIESRESYYYRRVFTDAARAVDTAAAHPRVDPKRIAVTGGSQGGGIAIAAAGLRPKQVKVLMADVPYLCYYQRATQIVDSMPYAEISNYLKTHRGRTEKVFQTLAYFDGINFAPRIAAHTLFSIGLMDTVCPPSTCFAAFNRIKGRKEVKVYDYNNHEGGGVFQAVERLRFARKHL